MVTSGAQGNSKDTLLTADELIEAIDRYHRVNPEPRGFPFVNHLLIADTIIEGAEPWDKWREYVKFTEMGIVSHRITPQVAQPKATYRWSL